MFRRTLLTALARTALSCTAVLAGIAHAQDDYPSRPVKLIVPFPAGGTSDIMGRLIADALGRQLKQPFIVDNKGGAGGAIGTEQAAKAPGDGYTLLLSGIGSNAIIHGFSPKPPYDSNRDFVHVSQLAAGPNVLVVNPSFPAKNFKEFIAWVKANPGKFSYGQVNASSGHVTTEYLKQVAGLDMVGIPYKGGAPALNDVLADQIPGMFTNQDAVLPHIKAGKLRAIAVGSGQRVSLLPDVKTVAEQGFPGFDATSWGGLLAPAGTPKEVIDRMSAELKTALADKQVQEKLESVGSFAAYRTPEQTGTRMRQDFERWGKVIRDNKITNQ